MEWTDIVVGTAAIGLLVLGIVKIIVKLTPDSKDDEVFDKVEDVVEPILKSVAGKDDEE